MNMTNKKLHVSLVLIAVVVIFSTQFSIVYSVETTASDELLKFLEDVVKIDMTNYDVDVLGSLVSQPDWLGGLSQTTGKVTLESKTSKLSVLYTITDDFLSWCQVTATEGNPQYSQELPKNAGELTGGFLQRYQTYTEDSKLEKMRQILDAVDVTQNTTKTVDNLKLGVSVDSFSSSFSWTNTYNGADYSGICVSFKDGDFYSLKDERSYYKIGGTDVNIDSQDAIDIALKTVEGLSWSVAGENITEFRVLEDLISAKLLTRSKTPLELYPYWLVDLPLDEIYPGNVYTITVLIWADTSEILDCYTKSYGGDIPVTLDTSPTSDQQLLTETTASTDPLIITVALAVITLLSLGVCAKIIKTRKNHKTKN